MVLLVYIDKTKNITEPLAISSLHAYLKSCNIKVDMHYERLENISLLEKLNEVNPKIVGVSILTQINKTIDSDLKNTVDTILRFNSDIKILVGGHQPTIDPYSFLISGVEAVIVGYGEIALLEYVNSFVNNIDKPRINGLIYSKSDIITGATFFDLLDDLPFVSRNYLTNIKSKLGLEPVVQILSSRGCVSNCSFCSIKKFMDNSNVKYLERSVQNVTDEIELLYHKHGARRFVFEDDNFFSSKNVKEKSRQFFDEFNKRNINDITIKLQIKPSFIEAESIKLLKKIGVKSIFIGIENFNDVDLNFYQKGINSSVIHKCIDVLINAGYSFNFDAEYRIYGGYICFNPYSTIETLANSSKWLKYYGIPAKKLLSKVIVFKNTCLYNLLFEKNMLNNDGDFRFFYKEVEKKYNILRELFDILSLKRELYRFPLKFSREHGKIMLSDVNMEKAKLAVALYENTMFDSFDIIINATENYDIFFSEALKKSCEIDDNLGIYPLVLEICENNREILNQ
jgi:radical SAM superfamily enzyme YgiQ (UPF0313 family)